MTKKVRNPKTKRELKVKTETVKPLRPKMLEDVTGGALQVNCTVGTRTTMN